MTPEAEPPRAGVRELLPLLRPHRRPLLVGAGLSLVAAAGALAAGSGSREPVTTIGSA